jgi:ribosomal protein S18 acetylase RimI-like enzyme
MQTDRPAPAPEPTPATPVGAAWLDPRWDALVAELLYDAYPNSYARPGLAGVRRWAGTFDTEGELAAVAADAWSAPGVGYLAGVATRPSARRLGFGLAAFRFALDTLVAEHGRAALMVDSANTGALGLYQRMGMSWRELGAACVPVRSSAA